MRGNWFRVAALAIVFGLALVPAVAQDVPPVIDDQTSGAWIGMYGECASVLGAYDAARGCEIPILEEGLCLPPTCVYIDGVPTPTCPGSYQGGAGQDILDCEDLDLNADGTQDVFYRVYSGNVNSRVLNDENGNCSGENALWFSQTKSGCGGDTDKTFSYQINGVPAGNYRLAVYVLDFDSAVRDQDMTVCVGAACSGAMNVGDHHYGVYQLFDIAVAAGDAIVVTHAGTAGANAVAQGVFFDAAPAAPTCANGKACATGTQDRDTQGNWNDTYGADGYILLNRPNPVKTCQQGSPNYTIGNFAGAVTVVPLDNVFGWFWGNSAPISYECGVAQAYIWNCDDDSGRGLDNPGDCGGAGNCAGGFTSAATWDDAGERYSNGPDLYVDVEVDLPGMWELSFYALDYDQNNVRKEILHLYQYQSTVPVAPPVLVENYSNGKYVTYTLAGPFQVTLRAEKTAGANAIISGIFVDPLDGYTCEGEEPGEECDTNPGDFCTYTIGGWGAKYAGANPGTIRDDNWMTVYPVDTYPDSDDDGYGDLVIDGSLPQCKSMTFTDPMAVENYMPCGGQPRATNKSFVDPECTRKGNAPQKNTLMSQVLGLRLNVDYSCAGVLDAVYPNDDSSICLGDLIISSGPFVGDTVYEFLEKAEDALLCGLFAEGLQASDYNWTATAINENFDGCEDSNGFLDCPGGGEGPGEECGLTISKSLALGDLGPVDRDGDGMGPDAYPGEEVTFTLDVAAGGSDLTGVTVTDVLPTFMLAGVTYDYYFFNADCTFTPNLGQSCSFDDTTNTLTVNLGNMGAGGSVQVSYTAQVNLLAPIGSEAVNTASVTGFVGTTLCSDDDMASVWIVPDEPGHPTNDIGTPGYVCNHVDQGKNNAFDAAEINNWLWAIEASSRWWSEYGGDLYDPSEPPTFQNVLAIVCANQNQGSDKDKLERHLLTLWFNVADFRVTTTVTLEEICVGGVNFPAGYDKTWTIGDVITYAESELLDANATPYDYLFWKDVIDAINNGNAPGSNGC